MPAPTGGIDMTNSGEIFDESFEVSVPSLENESSSQKHKIGNAVETPCTKKRQRAQQKADERRDNIDLLLVNALSKSENSETAAQSSKDEESSNMLFCKSLVPILESLPPKKNRLARLEIQKLLISLEFDD